jgi:hypothetical protein
VPVHERNFEWDFLLQQMRYAEYRWRSVLQSLRRFHQPDAGRYPGFSIVQLRVALLNSSDFLSGGRSSSGSGLRRILDSRVVAAIIDGILLRVVVAPVGMVFGGPGWQEE